METGQLLPVCSGGLQLQLMTLITQLRATVHQQECCPVAVKNMNLQAFNIKPHQTQTHLKDKTHPQSDIRFDNEAGYGSNGEELDHFDFCKGNDESLEMNRSISFGFEGKTSEEARMSEKYKNVGRQKTNTRHIGLQRLESEALTVMEARQNENKNNFDKNENNNVERNNEVINNGLFGFTQAYSDDKVCKIVSKQRNTPRKGSGLLKNTLNENEVQIDDNNYIDKIGKGQTRTGTKQESKFPKNGLDRRQKNFNGKKMEINSARMNYKDKLGKLQNNFIGTNTRHINNDANKVLDRSEFEKLGSEFQMKQKHKQTRLLNTTINEKSRKMKTLKIELKNCENQLGKQARGMESLRRQLSEAKDKLQTEKNALKSLGEDFDEELKKVDNFSTELYKQLKIISEKDREMESVKQVCRKEQYRLEKELKRQKLQCNSLMDTSMYTKVIKDLYVLKEEVEDCKKAESELRKEINSFKKVYQGGFHKELLGKEIVRSRTLGKELHMQRNFLHQQAKQMTDAEERNCLETVTALRVEMHKQQMHLDGLMHLVPDIYI